MSEKRRRFNSSKDWDTRRLILIAHSSFFLLFMLYLPWFPAEKIAAMGGPMQAAATFAAIVLPMYMGIAEAGRVLMAQRATEQTVSRPPADEVVVTTTETKGEPSGPAS